jgi:bifunctional UDP-N-acetylglucosamine pyrophosphorylase/glucosamine-1-phosphate N-acetyltransferase
MNYYAIVLAAGRGKRMRDESLPAEFPKVLRQVRGRALVDYVVEALRGAGVTDITLIVGFGADYVRSAMGDGFTYATQSEQLGSGHAVACAREELSGRSGTAIVMCGDSPLFTSETILRLKEHHDATGATITLVSAVLDDPTGYGRIVRDSSGRITGIAEQKCATEAEKSIREINGGALAFDSEWLWANIDQMQVNEAGEQNLTDLVRVAISQGRLVEAVDCMPEEVMGVNTPDDLANAERILSGRG